MRLYLAATATTLSVLLVACGDPEPAADTTPPTSAATAAGSTSTTSPTTPTTTAVTTTMPTTTSSTVPTLPEPVTADGVPVVDVAEREEGRWELRGGPDWTAVGFDSLWVKRDNGSVVRIDPRTGEVQAEIELDPVLCQGLGAGADAVWACTRASHDVEASVAQIDPATNQVVASYPVDKSSDQGRLVAVDGRTWVLSGGDTLIGIGSDGSLSEPIDLGMFCTDLIGGNEELWVACSSPGVVAKVDIAGGTLTDRIALPRAFTGTRGEYLWVGFQGGVAQIDPGNLEIVAVYEVWPNYGAIIESGDDVWVRSAGSPALTRIDPHQRTVVEAIEVPDIRSGGDVVVVDGSLWLTFYDDQTLLRLSTG